MISAHNDYRSCQFLSVWSGFGIFVSVSTTTAACSQVEVSWVSWVVCLGRRRMRTHIRQTKLGKSDMHPIHTPIQRFSQRLTASKNHERPVCCEDVRT